MAFTFEVVIRIVCMPDGLIICASDPFMWIDILAVLPFALEYTLFQAVDADFDLDFLRLVRLLRLLKLARHYEQSRVLLETLKIASEGLLVRGVAAMAAEATEAADLAAAVRGEAVMVEVVTAVGTLARRSCYCRNMASSRYISSRDSQCYSSRGRIHQPSSSSGLPPCMYQARVRIYPAQLILCKRSRLRQRERRP